MTNAIEKLSQAEKWLSEARKGFRPGKSEPCKVCDKWKSITEPHHVIPLSFQKDESVIDHSHVWLCPTHHFAVSLFISLWNSESKVASPKIFEMITELSESGELKSIIEIAQGAFGAKNDPSN